MSEIEKKIATDVEGFLLNPASWTEEIAAKLAAEEGITLDAERLELIHITRQFYAEFQMSPAMRPLVAYIRQHLGAEQASSIYLMQRFGSSPAKMLSKIAGLPKPDNCL